MALVNGGTIPDTGMFPAYTTTGIRIGELDEEFVYERRVGDAFLLGTNAWRVTRIEADRVQVEPAEGAHAVLPFWRGERPGRSHELGLAVGRFLRELAERIDLPDCSRWLIEDYFLEPNAARNLVHHVRRQLEGAVLPTDRTLAVEASRDQLGDWQVILLSPFGARLHLSLRLALEHRLNERLGYRPQCLHHDDGILVRLNESDEPVLDLLDGLTPEDVEERIVVELADSALFALRFRQNAARALMLPRSKPGQRAPLWLQRLRGKDLLQVARKHGDFPVVVETFRECLHDHLDVPRLRELLADLRDGRIRIEVKRRELPSPFAANIVFSFTAANLYRTDEVEPERDRPAHLDQEVLQQLLAPDDHRHLLDPRAVHQVERRLRGVGHPPRSVAETAEWLRRLGDLAPDELEGPMAGFLEALAAEGRASLLELPRVAKKERWVSAEERELYLRAFGLEESSPEEQQVSATVILERFLRTHALVSLADVLARYPFEREWAERQLCSWAENGRAVVVPLGVDDETVQWSAPENLEQVQRGSLGLLRREVLTCTAPQLADFVLRWQGAHPERRRGGTDGLAETLARLQGLPLPAELWEQAVLPARVPGYLPRWLDEWVAGGAGAWVAAGESLAFLDREEVLESARPTSETDTPLATEEQTVVEILRQRGASFVVDLAHATGLGPAAVRDALWSLLARSLVTNDHFDVIRRGRPETPPLPESTAPRLTRVAPRRGVQRPEGRWSVLPWALALSPEVQAVRMASRLLHRYGIAARELALLDPWMPPWRILYEVLSRMELAGEVRRGYFAEGLSGAQFALPEAMPLLQEQHSPSTATAPVVLLHSLDPANLYGSGAPLDVPLLDGGTRSFVRRAGNWIVLRAGKPILLIEQQGKKLTALASAAPDDVAAAVACLPALCESRGNIRHSLTVEEWNGRPATTSEARELLEKVGFVRDYQGMTLYAVWK